MRKSTYAILIAAAVIIACNFLANRFNLSVDLTEEKRYTLTRASKNVIKNVDDIIFVRILLAGELPAELKRLKNNVEDILKDIHKLNPNIQYVFDDPFKGSTEEVNARVKELQARGIGSTRLNIVEKGSQEQKRVYPFALINYGERQVAINLLEPIAPGFTAAESLNNSIALLEYKFVDAFAKLFAKQKQNILFTEGHGELRDQQLASLESSLRAYYNTGRINPSEHYKIPDEVDLIIMAKPTKAFSDTAKFVIDQYIMNGGKAIFLIDPLAVNIDSIGKNGSYVPYDYDLNLSDQFFKYGFRIRRDLVLDLESSRIDMVVGSVGGEPQRDLIPWPYHPAPYGKIDHPVVRGLQSIHTQFPATIDTNIQVENVQRTALITSSEYTTTQVNPVELKLSMVDQIDPTQFNKPPSIIALLLEGSFTSLYRNRVPAAMASVLKEIGSPYKEQSVETKILVVSDGDVVRNLINPSNGEYLPLGFNRNDRRTYENLKFIQNAINYMLDDLGIVAARNKELKLRLLNKPKIASERTKWQVINVVSPVLLLLLAALITGIIRKRRYAG